jgi:hypothetical protein
MQKIIDLSPLTDSFVKKDGHYQYLMNVNPVFKGLVDISVDEDAKIMKLSREVNGAEYGVSDKLYIINKQIPIPEDAIIDTLNASLSYDTNLSITVKFKSSRNKTYDTNLKEFFDNNIISAPGKRILLDQIYKQMIQELTSDQPSRDDFINYMFDYGYYMLINSNRIQYIYNATIKKNQNIGSNPLPESNPIPESKPLTESEPLPEFIKNNIVQTSDDRDIINIDLLYERYVKTLDPVTGVKGIIKPAFVRKLKGTFIVSDDNNNVTGARYQPQNSAIADYQIDEIPFEYGFDTFGTWTVPIIDFVEQTVTMTTDLRDMIHIDVLREEFIKYHESIWNTPDYSSSFDKPLSSILGIFEAWLAGNFIVDYDTNMIMGARYEPPKSSKLYRTGYLMRTINDDMNKVFKNFATEHLVRTVDKNDSYSLEDILDKYAMWAKKNNQLIPNIKLNLKIYLLHNRYKIINKDKNLYVHCVKYISE